jgi:hypothetical protein
MAESQITRTYRLSIRAMLAGVVMLAGAIAAFAARAAVVGVIFLVLMLACTVAGFVAAVSFRNRAVALARKAREEQKADLRASFKNTPPHRLP